MFTRNRNIRFLAIFALVLVLAGATYAFAAANTVPASKAGDGVEPFLVTWSAPSTIT